VSARAAITVFLIGLGAAWNAGNVGPVVAPLAEEFDVSLSQVGLLSGSVFCVGVAGAGFFGSVLSERLSVIAGLRLCCLVCFAGNILFAISPVFGLLLAARVLVGLGLGLAFLFGGVFARDTGGGRLVGVFGAGITLGIACALGVGALMEDAGLDWRLSFALSALLGASALPLLPSHSGAKAPRHEPPGELFAEAARSPRFWRLEMVAVSAFSIPIVIGAWLVHYLATEGGLSTSTAGLIAFGLFGASAFARDFGGQLVARQVSQGAISLGGLTLGAAGLALLGLEPSLGGALGATVLIGFGLSLPYAAVYDQGVRVIPESPVGGLGLVQATANSFPIPVTPLFGAALASGDGTAAWLALAAFVLLAGLANARPAVPAAGSPG
jgi:DHA1 family purine ribonucleoside efflux pump-like MFS transporter